MSLKDRLREATKMRALAPVAVGGDNLETVQRIASPMCEEIGKLRALSGEAAARIEALEVALRDVRIELLRCRSIGVDFDRKKRVEPLLSMIDAILQEQPRG